MSQWVHNVLALAFGLGGLAVLLGITPVRDPIIGVTLAGAAGIPVIMANRERARQEKTGAHPMQEPKP